MNPGRTKKLMKARILTLTRLILGYAIFVAMTANPSWAQHAHPAPHNIAPAIGSNAIPFDLKTLEGKTAALESFHGKPLVINFFASWCDPCREEMPLINGLAAKASGSYQVLGRHSWRGHGVCERGQAGFSHRARPEQHRKARVPNFRPTGDLFCRRRGDHSRHRPRANDRGSRQRRGKEGRHSALNAA